MRSCDLFKLSLKELVQKPRRRLAVSPGVGQERLVGEKRVGLLLLIKALGAAFLAGMVTGGLLALRFPTQK
jgi:hypothetical protein